ncbi:hypothetical protein [Streptomyces sp. NPDC051310]|uniref:hypothetical protein n=1 Tax=Streptomyces sp. NPDC051310 TaxID=3365649 RepID=UPI00379A9157
MTPPRPAVTAGVIAVRVIICVLIVLTLGMLAWVAMLRIAIMRRSGRDWALFWGQLVLNIACLATLEQRLADHWISNVGMAGLLLQMAGVVTYYLIVDIHHHQRVPAAAPQGHVLLPAYGPPPQYGYGRPPAPAPTHAPPTGPFATPIPAPAHAPAPPTGPLATPIAAPAPAPAPAPLPVQPPPQPPRPPAGPPAPHRHIDQVRAELDELSDLLRRNDGQEGGPR